MDVNQVEAVKQLGFAIYVACGLFSLFSAILIGLVNYMKKTLNDKLDKIQKEVEEWPGVLSSFKEILQQVNQQSITALNIILKNRVNGKDKED